MPTGAEIEALYKRADEAFQKHHYDYARDLFLQILLFDLDHDKTRRALKVTIIRKFQEQGASGKIRMIALKGQFELQIKATRDSKKRTDLCQKFLNDDPTNSKVRALLADALLALGHSKGAAAEAEMAIQDDGMNVSAAKTLVSAYRNTGNVKDAQVWLDRIGSLVKNDRDLDRLHRDLAAMQSMKAGFEDISSKDSFRKVLKNVDQAEELEKRTKLIQSDADFIKMVEEIQAEISGNPTDARLPKRIGDLYFEKKKDYVSAQDWYRKASRLAPQDSVLRDKGDDCQIRLHDLQIENAKKVGDPKLNDLILARLKFITASFERRVQDRPTDMGLRFDLGKAYYVGSLTDKAIGEFQQAVKDPKKKSDAHFYLGRAFQKKKMFDMADKQYASAEVDVLSQDRKLEIQYYRAISCTEAGHLAKAIELGNKIVEIDISYKDISELVEKWSQMAGNAGG
jgi:tetratricopeptide (TPR) repeat protein